MSARKSAAICLNCGKAMEFIGLIPAGASCGDIRTYACQACNKVVAIPPEEKLHQRTRGSINRSE